MTAESWIHELRIHRLTVEEVARTQGEPIPERSKQGVRVTIVEIPEATKVDPVEGKIVVEADGIRAEMYASVFYNCIKGPYKELFFKVDDDRPLIGETESI